MKTITSLKKYRDFIRTVRAQKLHDAIWMLEGSDSKLARQKMTLIKMELNYRAAA